MADDIKQYPIGAEARVSVEFYDAAGDPMDPTTVYLMLKKPGQAQELFTYPPNGTINRSDVGKFYSDVYLTAHPGKWAYRFIGIGALRAAGERFFEVMPSVFSPALP